MNASSKSPAVTLGKLEILNSALWRLIPADSAVIYAAVCDKEEVECGPNFKDLDGKSMLVLLELLLSNMLTAVHDAQEHFELVNFAQEISNEPTP